MVKLSNGEIFAASKPLESLSKEKMPLKPSYRIAMLVKKLSSQLEVIEKIRIGLVQKYGEKNEKGDVSIQQNTSNWFLFIGEMNELFAQEVEIEFEKIELPSEVDGKAFNIEPSVLISLEKFIDIK
jgi:hypothetical protein